jgi:hypothetical protein
MKRFSVLAVGALLAGVVAFGASPAQAAGPTCNGTYSGATFGALVVPANTICVIRDTTVNGSVQVGQGANFETCNSKIAGALVANKAYVLLDHNTTVGGAIDIVPGVGALPPGGAQCSEREGLAYTGMICPSKIGGNLVVRNAPYDTRPFEIGECGPVKIVGQVSIHDNQVPVSIEDSTIGGNLTCYNNNPPAVQHDNTVAGHIVGCLEGTMVME